MNKIMAGLTTVAISALGSAAASAENRVLDFAQGNYCRDGQLCTNNGTIDQSYGDTENLDVNYYTVIEATRSSAFYYERGYGDLEGVLYAGNGFANARGQVIFTASEGFELSLTSFDVGCFNGNANCRTFDYNVFAEGGPIAEGARSTNYPGHATIDIGSAYYRQLALNFGTGDNVGLDNIRFDIRPSATPGAVPEPTTWAMLVLGFGAAGASVRSRKRTTTIAFS